MATNGAINGSAAVQPNKGALVTAAILVGVGGILGATGILIGTASLLSAARQWIKQLDRPPSETAKLRWKQLKHAGTAGAKAWREHGL